MASDAADYVLATYPEIAQRFGLGSKRAARTKVKRAGWGHESANHPYDALRIRVPRSVWDQAQDAHRDQSHGAREDNGPDAEGSQAHDAHNDHVADAIAPRPRASKGQSAGIPRTTRTESKGGESLMPRT
jgi:hypothetical protein